MSFEEKIELFFRDPRDLNPKDTIHSTLFLLRRDIFTCFGFNPNDHSRISYQALFPGTMAIMAGIDFLAKFHFTDQEAKDNSSGKRFKKYTKKYIDNRYEEELYQLRNSLIHSFGLYSKSKGKTPKVFFFTLHRGLKDLVQKSDENNYWVDIEMLRSRFENSVIEYSNELVQSEILRNNFEAMFNKYGVIGMKKIS